MYYFKKSLLFGVLAPLFFMSGKASDILDSGVPVDILSEAPCPGKTAFVVAQPSEVPGKQRYLIFLPSCHSLPLSKVDRSLLKIVKGCGVLVSENDEEFEQGKMSLDKYKRLESMLMGNSEYKKAALISDGLLLINSPFLIADKEWATSLTPKLKVFLEQATMRYLEGIPLSHLHPYVIADALRHLAGRSIERLMGMDCRLSAFFQHARKPCYGLETKKELSPELEELKLQRPKGTLDESVHRLICLADDYIDDDKELTLRPNETAKTYNEFYRQGIWSTVDPKTAERTKDWIPNLLTIFKAHPNESIAIELGTAHFHGPNGVIAFFTRDHSFSFVSLKFAPTPVLLTRSAIAIDEIMKNKKAVLQQLVPAGPISFHAPAALLNQVQLKCRQNIEKLESIENENVIREQWLTLRDKVFALSDVFNGLIFVVFNHSGLVISSKEIYENLVCVKEKELQEMADAVSQLGQRSEILDKKIESIQEVLKKTKGKAEQLKEALKGLSS